MPSIPTILVTGDIVLDHHIYGGERQHFLDPTSRGARIVREPGGAAFTHRLIGGALRLDHERLRHNCLLPCRGLSEIDREKDRDSIRHYPDFPREARWKIVFG